MRACANRASHERDVNRFGRVDVVEVARPAAEDALVLPPGDRLADQPTGQARCPAAITSFRPGEVSCRSQAALTSSSGTTSRSTLRRPAATCSLSLR